MRCIEGNATCRKIGDLWLQRTQSLILEVPSAALPYEYNVLISPRHPEINDLIAANPILEHEPEVWDRRIAEIIDKDELATRRESGTA